MTIKITIGPDNIKRRPGVRAILARLDTYSELIKDWPGNKRQAHVALTNFDMESLCDALRGGAGRVPA